MSYSLGGHAGFGNLLSPAGQIAVGKQFMPQLSARVAVGGWRGKAMSDVRHSMIGFYHMQASVDGLWNVSQTISLNEDRPVDVNVIVGVGFDRQFTYNVNSFLGRAGLGLDVHLCKAIDLNVEAIFNGVNDNWNTLDNGGIDAYFNLMVGATYKFGTGYKCKSCITPAVFDNDQVNEMREAVAAAPDTVVTVVEEPVVEEPVVVVEEVVEVAAPIEREVFFEINQTTVSANQESQVAEIAEYLKENPNATVEVRGFADRGTGTTQINLRLAHQRATNVASMLEHKFGVSASRIEVSSMQNPADQPFSENSKNRVVLMLAGTDAE